MAKMIKDKLGYEHTAESLKKTQETLSKVKDGDVVRFSRQKKDSGQGFASIIMGGKEWKSYNGKTLLEYSTDGFDLEIIGHWRDGVNKGAFWNDISRFGYDLVDLMELNATI